MNLLLASIGILLYFPNLFPMDKADQQFNNSKELLEKLFNLEKLKKQAEEQEKCLVEVRNCAQAIMHTQKVPALLNPFITDYQQIIKRANSYLEADQHMSGFKNEDMEWALGDYLLTDVKSDIPLMQERHQQNARLLKGLSTTFPLDVADTTTFHKEPDLDFSLLKKVETQTNEEVFNSLETLNSLVLNFATILNFKVSYLKACEQFFNQFSPGEHQLPASVINNYIIPQKEAFSDFQTKFKLLETQKEQPLFALFAEIMKIPQKTINKENVTTHLELLKRKREQLKDLIKVINQPYVNLELKKQYLLSVNILDEALVTTAQKKDLFTTIVEKLEPALLALPPIPLPAPSQKPPLCKIPVEALPTKVLLEFVLKNPCFTFRTLSVPLELKNSHGINTKSKILYFVSDKSSKISRFQAGKKNSKKSLKSTLSIPFKNHEKKFTATFSTKGQPIEKESSLAYDKGGYYYLFNMNESWGYRISRIIAQTILEDDTSSEEDLSQDLSDYDAQDIQQDSQDSDSE